MSEIQNLDSTLSTTSTFIIEQRFEVAELFGFETRNRFAIQDETGHPVAYAAEQQKSFLGFLLRQFLGHWRSFEIHFFDLSRRPSFIAHHPFRFFFQRLECRTHDGRALGTIQQRIAFFSKRFDILSPQGHTLMSVSSPIWRLWTFSLTRQGREVARIEKKWTGLLQEAFTDRDRFRVNIHDSNLSIEERKLLLAAAIFVDLQYFEKKE